jgi:hypothetical protein
MRPYEAPKRRSVKKKTVKDLSFNSQSGHRLASQGLAANFKKSAIAALRACCTLFKDFIYIWNIVTDET